jgi:hypothetical protein
MGPYDHYAVNWGYRYLAANSAEAERATLNSWVLEKADDPKYKFGRQSSRFDPQSQTESIGDDPIKASTYGIKNLKYVAANLPKWTSDVTNDYQDLEELYGELMGVYSRYAGHVTNTIGGVYENIKTPEQIGTVYSNFDTAAQKKAMQWLHTNIFETPDWLLKREILKNIDHAGHFEKLRRLQTRQLNALLSFERLGRLIDGESLDKDYYSTLSMLKDLRNGIWKEASRGLNVDLHRRNLQRSYVDRMAYLMTEELQPNRFRRPGFEGQIYYNANTSDVRALVRGELKALKSRLNAAKNGRINKVTKYHYEDVIARIENIFDAD